MKGKAVLVYDLSVNGRAWEIAGEEVVDPLRTVSNGGREGEGRVAEAATQRRRKSQTRSPLNATQFYICIEIGNGRLAPCVE